MDMLKAPKWRNIADTLSALIRTMLYLTWEVNLLLQTTSNRKPALLLALRARRLIRYLVAMGRYTEATVPPCSMCLLTV